MKHERKFESEAALCAAFCTWAKRYGYTPYAETAGWDVLLVDTLGHQIGVQAKLRCNEHLITQVMPSDYRYGPEIGPDHRAVLVPKHPGGFGELLNACGVAVFYPSYSFRGATEFERLESGFGALFDWNPAKRCELPEYVPDVVAGSSAPIQLTPWKVGALKLLATLELRGYLVKADFADAGIDPRRWKTEAWVVPGAPGQWIAGRVPAFAQQHPEVYPKVKADIAKRLATVIAA